MDNNYLEHHGIMGMHWGIRRFQPYSVTGPRKNGKTGQEIGDAARSKAVLKKERHEYRVAKKQYKQDLKKEKIAKKELAEQEKIDKKKNKLIKSGTYEEVSKFNKKHKGEFTPEEIDRIVKRLSSEKRLIESGKEIETAMKKLDKAFYTIDSLQRKTETGIKAYNTTSKILNSLYDEEILPEIHDSKTRKEMKAKEAQEHFNKLKNEALNSGDRNKIWEFNQKYGSKVSFEDLNKAYNKADLYEKEWKRRTTKSTALTIR